MGRIPSARPASGVTGNLLSSDTGAAATAATAPFGHALVQAAAGNPRIVGLTADLGKYTDLDIFAEQFPERFFQIGMAEQNLIGVAAGLARTGFVPFATTYCVFATRRAYDFIAIGCALGKANVKIIAGLPGLTTGYGGTHQGIEDLALMRSIPNLVVIDGAYQGPVYMRLLRGQVPVVLDPATYQFQIGKARLLRDGHDVAIISTGLMTGRALEACSLLARENFQAALLHVSTLKPFDRESVLALLARVRAVVTAENHIVTGGLASSVADAVADAGLSVRIKRVGIPDAFCASGSVPYLVQRYHLDAESIAAAARSLLQ